MKTRKKSSTKKNQYNDLTSELMYVIPMLFFVLSFISILSDRTGIVGNILGDFYFYLFGIGAYLFPLLMIWLVVLLWRKRFYGSARSKLLWSFALLFVLLLLADTIQIPETSLQTHIQIAHGLSENQGGPGLLGAFLSHYVYLALGPMGIVLIAMSVVFFAFLSFSGKKLGDVFIFLKEQLTRLKAYFIKKINAYKASKQESKEKKPLDHEIQKEDEDLLSGPDRSLSQKSDQLKIKSEIRIRDYLQAENLPGTDAAQMVIQEASDQRRTPYRVPPLTLLKSSPSQSASDEALIRNQAQIIEETLLSFGIEVEIVQINRGPTVTCYELKPAPGVKLSRIVNLSDNLSLSLASSDIRIEAPIAGKPYVGIEVPNKHKDTVALRDIFQSEAFQKTDVQLPLALGKNISGDPVISAIEKMPHMLIAGATGSGKSVCINTIIMSIIYKCHPDDVKLILIDPKVVELSIYNGIPHLSIPVVTDPKKASAALYWAVKEMERRYLLFSEYSVRDIRSYRQKCEFEDLEHLPYIVIIIDELSDLMMVAAQSVEDHIIRLAQMARACGIHLIIATQRPTVDVITGTIKANIPSRISFAVSSQIDSRTIIDMSGAEKLLGKGDMLFFPSDYLKPKRLQGAFISDQEVEKVVAFLKAEADPSYDESIMDVIDQETVVESTPLDDEVDELLNEAMEIVISDGHASVSLIQRRLKVGYARAGRIIDQLEERGIVGPYEGSKPRKVLVGQDFLERRNADEFSE